jgi:hypothetical protein
MKRVIKVAVVVVSKYVHGSGSFVYMVTPEGFYRSGGVV